jgi:hypothetical protein
MPRHFSLRPAVYQIPAIDELRQEWRRVPDIGARNVIAVEAQYLSFQRYLLESLRHRDPVGGGAIPLGLSVRAGALKTATLVCASIAEAALRAHAEKRGYDLPVNARQRTFGRVLGAWQQPDGSARPEVAAVWMQLQALHSGRNNVHLYGCIEQGNNFYEVLQSEARSLSNADRVLAVLKALESSI